MNNQRGQAQLAVLAVIIIGFFIYTGLTKNGTFSLPFKRPTDKAEQPQSQESKDSSGQKSYSVPSSSPTPTPTPILVLDTTAPGRFSPQPKNKSSLPAETRQLTLGIETDEKATCKYSHIANTDYFDMGGMFDQTDSILHSTVLAYISEGTSYEYFIRCIDREGNRNTDDFTISFKIKTAEDETPPVISNVSHQGDLLEKGTRAVIISVSTDEEASCRYSTEPGKTYSRMSGRFVYYDTTKRFHIKTITGLEDGKLYNYYVRCKDLEGNSNTNDVLISFSVAQ